VVVAEAVVGVAGVVVVDIEVVADILRM